MRRQKVLVFVITDFGRSDGAVLWATNLLECLARVQGMDFIIVSSGPSSAAEANQKFASSLGLRHAFVPFRAAPGRTRDSTVAVVVDRALTILLEKFYFLLERDARRQKHVDSVVMEMVDEIKPDMIIVNGRNAALHVRSVFASVTPCCFVTLDNEIAYQQLHRSQSGPLGERLISRLERWACRHGNWVANWRFRRYIEWLYEHCVGIVALSRNDLPAELPARVVRSVIPPVLKSGESRWLYRGSRRLLFVGNIQVLKVRHVANRMAIEWICTKLAPELWRFDDSIGIAIIGAEKEQVPSSWHAKNVSFLGRSSREELVRQMTTADLFVAPIDNNLGAKLKLAECVSHGMPFLATDAAMSGLPFLSSVPRMELAQPLAAARRVVQYLNSPEELARLSESIIAQAHKARVQQDLAWTRFLDDSIAATAERAVSSEAPGGYEAT